MINCDQVQILLVEDDKVDREAIRRAFSTLKLTYPVFEAKDGEHAFEILEGKNGKEQIKYPFLVILDLNMPRMDGLEFLSEFRKIDKYKAIPVFVLTTSDDDHDIWESHNLHISGYLLKDEAGDNFRKYVKMMHEFLLCVKLPTVANSD